MDLPRIMGQIGIDLRVVAFTVLVTLEPGLVSRRAMFFLRTVMSGDISTMRLDVRASPK
jgi:hypothetical protein